MTNHGAGAEEPAAFDKLMNEVMASAKRFGHREHIYLTWLAIREFGVAAAVALVSEGIQRTARYAGAPQKYNATVSRAWVELVGHHTTESPDADFARDHAALLDKRLLTRFYRPGTLARPAARRRWVEPDLAPFPWHPAQPCNVAEAPIGAVTLRAGCSAGDASIQRLAELDRAAPCRARYSWPWWGDEP